MSRLLQTLVDCPQIFWLKGPSQPIAWRAGQLEGVTDLLPKVEGARQSRAIESVKVAREGATERPRGRWNWICGVRVR